MLGSWRAKASSRARMLGGISPVAGSANSRVSQSNRAWDTRLLADTDDELFPFAEIDLPGLAHNDQFEATILHRPLEHQPDRFMVFNYIKHSE